jgi:UDP-glucose 4-epimerase
MKRTILLLGGFGFIGTNILYFIDTRLIDLFDVIIFDKFEFHPKEIRFNCVKKIYCGDYSNMFDLELIFSENKIDFVLHALSTTVPVTSNNTRFDIESNLFSMINFLDLMVKYEVRKIIYISSGGAIYGNSDSYKKHNEKDAAYPISSYGIIKLTIEKYLYQYSYSYNIIPIIYRLSNPYGRYHYSTKQGVINIAARSAISSKPFFVWGDGNAKKDYIFVDDFCDILFKLKDIQEKCTVLNVGSGQVMSINGLLNNIRSFIPSFSWSYIDKNIADVQYFELDTSKLKSLIGEYDFTPFLVGLEKTINWLKESK